MRQRWFVVTFAPLHYLLIVSLMMSMIVNRYGCTDCTHGPSLSAVILDNPPCKDQCPSRLDCMVASMSEQLFMNAAHYSGTKISIVPSLTSSCAPDQTAHLSSNTPQFPEFSNIAHITAWRDFIAAHKQCGGVLVVLQGDASIGQETAGRTIVDVVSSPAMTDIVYFGYCFKSFGIPKFLRRKRFIKYHPNVTKLAPHCLYAYGVTQQGAAKLLEHVKECDQGPVDEQVAQLANSGIVTYSYVNTTYSTDYVQSQFTKFGVHWRDDSYGANRDGIFAQVVLDVNPPQSLPDGTAAHDLGRERTVFILADQQWRYIPNMDIYNKILGTAERGAVKVLTSWQFNHWKEGAPLSDADVPNMVMLRQVMSK